MTAAPNWYPKPGSEVGGALYWEDGAEMTDPDFEAWKDAGIE